MYIHVYSTGLNIYIHILKHQKTWLSLKWVKLCFYKCLLHVSIIFTTIQSKNEMLQNMMKFVILISINACN